MMYRVASGGRRGLRMPAKLTLTACHRISDYVGHQDQLR